MDDRRFRQTVNFRKRCTRIESRTPARYVYIVQGHRRGGRGTECSHIIIISETLEMSVTIMIASVSFFVQRKIYFFLLLKPRYFFAFLFFCLFFFSLFLVISISIFLRSVCLMYNKSFGLLPPFVAEVVCAHLRYKYKFFNVMLREYVLFGYTGCPGCLVCT